MKIATGCTALDWIADKAVFTTTEEYEDETHPHECWDQFVFTGTLNRKMVRQIRAWIDGARRNVGTNYHMDHCRLTIDGVRYEFDCRMPSDSKVDYDKSWIMILRYK